MNNAAQTVRRPPRFYEHMMAFEMVPFETLRSEIRNLLSAYEGLIRHQIPSATVVSHPSLHQRSSGASTATLPPTTSLSTATIEASESLSRVRFRSNIGPNNTVASSAKKIVLVVDGVPLAVDGEELPRRVDQAR